MDVVYNGRLIDLVVKLILNYFHTLYGLLTRSPHIVPCPEYYIYILVTGSILYVSGYITVFNCDV